MVIQLLPENQKIVDQLLHGKDTVGRDSALTAIEGLPTRDKQEIETYLIDRLKTEPDVWKRTWTLSAFAKLRLPQSTQVLLAHTDEQNESQAWARHFALLGAATLVPFPSTEIESATHDPDPLVQATALRLLLAHGEDSYVSELSQMLENRNEPQGQWAAARALRRRPGMVELRDPIEGQFIVPLTKLARDQYVWVDARWDAIQALSTVSYHQSDAAKNLGDMLIDDESDVFRRYALEALTKLGQLQESQEPLLRAIEDPDAEIRVRAAVALKSSSGAEMIIPLIIKRALDREKDTSFLVDALRQIDRDQSARIIQQTIADNPESEAGKRAARMLVELGGQEAARIILSERTRVLNTYTELLGKADSDVLARFTGLVSRANVGFWMSLIMHGTIFVIGVVVLKASLDLALSTGLDALQQLIGVGGSVGGLAILLVSFYRNPLENVRSSITALMKVNVVFLGYVRQINQIDATFKHQFLGNSDFGVEIVKSTVEEIQKAVKDTLEDIKGYLE